MGVHGLWKLLEASGKPVPLETLDNKVLAVDVSIWLHQLMKGFQDSRGSPLPNAHLLGLFHRVCKLLFYRIKPIFVFDGGVPLLKRQTIAARKKFKSAATQDAARIREQLLKNLIKRKAIKKVLQGKEGHNELIEEPPQEICDMFHLPPVQEPEDSGSESEEGSQPVVFSSDSDSESEYEAKVSPQKLIRMKLDMHSLDVKSEEFLSLPPDVRHDILSDLQETRKQNSWGRLHEMPEESTDFSSFQLGRLMKRRNIQVSLRQAEKEMGGKVLSLHELQELMSAQGVNIENEESSKLFDNASRKIAMDASTRYLLLKETPSKDASNTCNSQTEISNLEDKVLKDVKSESEDVEKMPPIFEDNWSSDEEVDQIMIDGAVAKAFSVENGDFSQEQILATIQLDKNIHEIDVEDSVENKPGSTIRSLEQPWADEQSNHLSNGSDSDDFQEVSKDSFEHVTLDGIRHTPVMHCEKTVSVVLSGNCDGGKNVSHVDSSALKITSPVSFEITVKPHEILAHDDIFADIFSNPVEPKNISRTKESHVETVPGLMAEPSDVSVSVDENLPTESETQREVERPSAQHISEDENSEYTKENHLQKMFESSEGKCMLDLQSKGFIETMSASKSLDPSVDSAEAFLENSEMNREDNKSPILSHLSPSKLQDLEVSLQEEENVLQLEKGRQERLAASITEQMCSEAQELLQLFGVPYIVAPMEAEAQCAFLDAISLTEGTITDDSDIWLFGGRKVYKNFFNQKKHVLQFTSASIHHYFKLSREQLVQLALLVGSDYTVGLQGVGPVTALEILATFSSCGDESSVERTLQGLKLFRDWCKAGRSSSSPQKQKLKKKIQNVKFFEGFPSQAVVEAYLRPAVDESRETFSWGTLDLPALRDYTRVKFGWTASKTDEILLPVSKRWSLRTSQKSIDSYFNFQHKMVEGLNKMSKRVQRAVDLISGQNGNDSSDDVDDPDPPNPAPKSKKRSSSISNKKDDSKRSKKNSPSYFDIDVCEATQSNVKDRKKVVNELPVRAPTVPRRRTYRGVQRVGLKSFICTDLNFKSDEKERLTERKLPDVSGMESGSTNFGVGSGERNYKFPLLEKSCGDNAVKPKSKSAHSKVSKPGEANVRIRKISKRNPKNNQGGKSLVDISHVAASDCRITKEDHLSCDVGSTGEDDRDETIIGGSADDHRPSVSGINKQITARSAVSDFLMGKRSAPTRDGNIDKDRCDVTVGGTSADDSKPSGSGYCKKRRSPCHTNTSSSEDEYVQRFATVELQAVAALDWQDDPWEDSAASSSERTQRPKLFFGGIRRNNPKKKRIEPPRNESLPIQPTSGDSRGFRPGWRTEENLQSRNALWLEHSQSKSLDVIPQREQDRQAQELAKVKAINVLKASGAGQASRILGSNIRGTKRGRGRSKTKPIRKELPEHNLSESSDE